MHPKRACQAFPLDAQPFFRSLSRDDISTRMPTAGPRRGFFDLWSRVYDFPPVQAATYRPVHNAVLRAVASLGDSGLRRIADIGCGTGGLLQRLRREAPDAVVVGVDFSEGMLGQAAKRQSGAVLVRGDACRLPLRSEAFDLVTTTEAFHWFPDQDAALSEFYRVLVPGGHALFALVNPLTPLVGRIAHAASLLTGQPFYWPSRAEIRDRLRAAGFEVEFQRWIFRVPGFLLPPSLTQAKRTADSARRTDSAA